MCLRNANCSKIKFMMKLVHSCVVDMRDTHLAHFESPMNSFVMFPNANLRTIYFVGVLI